jgi:AraC-like DNA-binding protein
VLQVRAVSLSGYTEVARFLGLDGFALLAECGIGPSALDDPEGRLPASAAVRLLERSAERSGTDSFGIRMAECRSLASIGPLSLLLQHLATVREVVTMTGRYRRLMSDVFDIELEERGDVAIIYCNLSSEISGAQAADLALGMTLTILAGASHGRWSPEVVHFTHGKPDDVSYFARYFRAPLEFDSRFSGFSCSRRSLDVPLPLADAGMAANAARLLAAAPPPSELKSVGAQVRRSIAVLLPTGRASLKAAAANLDTTQRSLQRALAAEGFTFAALLDEVRRELAERYLSNSRRSLTETAESLGYSKLSSFSRWFAQQFGESPSAWRKSQLVASHGPPPVWKIG